MKILSQVVFYFWSRFSVKSNKVKHFKCAITLAEIRIIIAAVMILINIIFMLLIKTYTLGIWLKITTCNKHAIVFVAEAIKPCCF